MSGYVLVRGGHQASLYKGGRQGVVRIGEGRKKAERGLVRREI